MTAEIAVYNRSAIALAADSASTVSNGRDSKVYNNAEKLFPLTKNHPIALMIYGSGELGGIPWELLIKAYRRKFGETSFDSLEEYARNFILFLSNFYPTIEREDHDLKNNVMDFILDTFDFVLDRAFPHNDCPPNVSKGLNKSINTIKQIIEQAENTESLSSVYEDEIQSLDQQPHSEIEAFFLPYLEHFYTELEIEVVHDKPKTIPTRFHKQFLKLLCLIFTKRNPIDSQITGLVFAGYGESEYLPVMHTFEVLGYFNNTLRFHIPEIKRVSKGEIGLTPFAQESEVEIFMEGISSTLKEMYHDSLDSMKHEALNGILQSKVIDKALKEKLFEELEAQLNEVHRSEIENFYDYIKSEQIHKIVEMIQHLPKNELAYMAESLVNLTAFKRKVSNDIDTVGGPIDVAVISKGEGLVWVKRKHYFPRELNNNYPTQP